MVFNENKYYITLNVSVVRRLPSSSPIVTNPRVFFFRQPTAEATSLKSPS